MTPSNRARKRTVNEGVRHLRARPGWDPDAWRRARTADAARERLPDDPTRERAFAASETCPDCARQRAATGDPTALCPAHLAEALGG
jgi:hypothetical protein